MMKYCIVYLSSPRDKLLSTGEKRFDMIKQSIINTSKIFNNEDYIIFHEDLNKYDEEELLTIYNNIKFIKLDFNRNELDFKQIGGSKGYMLMCRFFSGELQQILSDMGYEGYIRFDDDSFLIEPMLNKNKFEIIMNNSSYIYRTIFFDSQPKYNYPCNSLYEFTKKYIIDNGYDFNKIIQYLRNINFLNSNYKYTGLAPYNNFHFMNLKFYNIPFIKNYFDKLLEMNGCLMNYWMDANIHSMVIFMLLPFVNGKLVLQTDFGYRHNRHFSVLNSHSFHYKDNESFFPKNN